MKLKRVIIVALLAGIALTITLPQTSCRPNKPDTEVPADSTDVDTTKIDTTAVDTAK